MSFYAAFPVIFIDTVTANRYESEPSHLSCRKIKNCTFVGFMLIAVKLHVLKICSFQKGTLIKRAGVRTPWTPPWIGPWLEQCVYVRRTSVCAVISSVNDTID